MEKTVFINSKSGPFVDMIMNKQKIFETRSRDVLRFLFDTGERFLIAETGNGKPLVRCSARIRSIVTIYTENAWNTYRTFHAVPVGSEYDWKPGTRKKVLYELADVLPVPVPFHPEGKRHGRTWIECENFFG